MGPEMKNMYEQNVWKGCYRFGWQNHLVPEAFSHPAKVSFILAGKIYDHAIKMGWIKKGDTVLDPFGGICGFGFHALVNGINWVGVELEEKFVKLGQQNIDLWNRKFRDWSNLGTAMIVQGDSRNIQKLIRGEETITVCDKCLQASCWQGFFVCQESQKAGTIEKTRKQLECLNLENPCYWRSEQKEAALILGSPPYCHNRFDGGEESHRKKQGFTRGFNPRGGYGDHTPGNLANMKEGNIDAVIGSPPFCESLSSGELKLEDALKIAEKQNVKWKQGRDKKGIEKQASNLMRKVGHDYGHSPGQLGAMKEEKFDAIVSSPPWESIEGSVQAKKFKDDFAGEWSSRVRKGIIKGHYCSPEAKQRSMDKANQQEYGSTIGNLGNTSGDTFWAASRTILEQCHELLKPNGMAIWVCKDYVKAGKRVPFSQRWASLCESVGFKIVCWHHAMLVENYGFRLTLDGQEEEIQTSRKSFFRRLAEKNGSPRIDHEDVICMRKAIS